MARVNVDDSIFRDERFFRLAVTLGSRAMALGVLVFAWDMAQRFALSPHGVIPVAEWSKLEQNQAIMSAGLAELREGGVYVRGSGQHCEFIRRKHSIAVQNGKAGGAKSKENRRSRMEQKVAKSSSSPSPSPSYSPSDSNSKAPENPKPPSGGGKAGAFIGVYCKAWKARYETRPEILGKDQGIAKRMVEALGTERASELLESYLRMDTGWFLQKRHDLATFESNLNAVVQFHDTGETFTQSEIRHAETSSYHDKQLRLIAEGKL